MDREPVNKKKKGDCQQPEGILAMRHSDNAPRAPVCPGSGPRELALKEDWGGGGGDRKQGGKF